MKTGGGDAAASRGQFSHPYGGRRRFDNGGVTNGYYMGTPRTVADVMSAAPAVEDLILEVVERENREETIAPSLRGNYESILAAHLARRNLTRAVFDLDAGRDTRRKFFAKLRHGRNSSYTVVVPGGYPFSRFGNCDDVLAPVRECLGARYKC